MSSEESAPGSGLRPLSDSEIAETAALTAAFNAELGTEDLSQPRSPRQIVTEEFASYCTAEHEDGAYDVSKMMLEYLAPSSGAEIYQYAAVAHRVAVALREINLENNVITLGDPSVYLASRDPCLLVKDAEKAIFKKPEEWALLTQVADYISTNEEIQPVVKTMICLTWHLLDTPPNPPEEPLAEQATLSSLMANLPWAELFGKDEPTVPGPEQEITEGDKHSDTSQTPSLEKVQPEADGDVNGIVSDELFTQGIMQRVNESMSRIDAYALPTSRYLVTKLDREETEDLVALTTKARLLVHELGGHNFNELLRPLANFSDVPKMTDENWKQLCDGSYYHACRGERKAMKRQIEICVAQLSPDADIQTYAWKVALITLKQIDDFFAHEADRDRKAKDAQQRAGDFAALEEIERLLRRESFGSDEADNDPNRPERRAFHNALEEARQRADERVTRDPTGDYLKDTVTLIKSLEETADEQHLRLAERAQEAAYVVFGLDYSKKYEVNLSYTSAAQTTSDPVIQSFKARQIVRRDEDLAKKQATCLNIIADPDEQNFASSVFCLTLVKLKYWKVRNEIINYQKSFGKLDLDAEASELLKSKSTEGDE